MYSAEQSGIYPLRWIIREIILKLGRYFSLTNLSLLIRPAALFKLGVWKFFRRQVTGRITRLKRKSKSLDLHCCEDSEDLVRDCLFVSLYFKPQNDY